jgi:hypothetical protein
VIPNGTDLGRGPQGPDRPDNGELPIPTARRAPSSRRDTTTTAAAACRPACPTVDADTDGNEAITRADFAAFELGQQSDGASAKDSASGKQGTDQGGL